MTEEKSHSLFIQGAIPLDFISEIILQHNRNEMIGAYSIFLGQVRGDEAGSIRVKAVEYTAHTEMAMEKFRKIQVYLCKKHTVTSLLAFHSLGMVRTGEVCFFVFAASEHRGEAIKACNEAVEKVKSELAIWGKLWLENDTIQWKENK